MSGMWLEIPGTKFLIQQIHSEADEIKRDLIFLLQAFELHVPIGAELLIAAIGNHPEIPCLLAETQG